MFPLKLGPTGRYLVDQNGAPFLGKGDSGWEIITTLGLGDAETYLADRAAHGFNMVIVESVDNQFNYGSTVAGSTWGPNVNGDLPFTSKQGGGSYTNAQTQSPDFSTPNGAYWSYADKMLNLISSHGFLILLYPAWLGNPIGDPGSEGYYNALNAQSSSTRQGYGVFLAKRYGKGGTNPLPNMIWGIGGDANPANVAINTDIVAGINSIDGSHLFFVDGVDGSSMISLWGGDSWFSVNGVYSDSLLGHPWAYAQCKSEYQNTSGIQHSYPQFFKEGAYEGEHASTAQFIRSQSWQAMLGGSWGYFWGNNPLWLFASGWQSALSSVGSQGAQVVNGFFAARRWELLVPDWSFTFLTNGGSYNDATYASAAVASDGSWGAIYTPRSEALTVNLGAFSRAITASWVDPTNGAESVVVGSPFAQNGSHTFSATPGNNALGDPDWVLLFE